MLYHNINVFCLCAPKFNFLDGQMHYINEKLLFFLSLFNFVEDLLTNNRHINLSVAAKDLMDLLLLVGLQQTIITKH